ncbi:hypothetical protein E2C01_047353 [Portunus trituberculatus]|uniref:Uncharacterized protein n=1 Tax=Portunus trituberculatus TaxID=210409 RepID=A0A5B7G3D1_PORTR|nr:hypothetical protein [Portunus trituberculatus]
MMAGGIIVVVIGIGSGDDVSTSGGKKVDVGRVTGCRVGNCLYFHIQLAVVEQSVEVRVWTLEVEMGEEVGDLQLEEELWRVVVR